MQVYLGANGCGRNARGKGRLTHQSRGPLGAASLPASRLHPKGIFFLTTIPFCENDKKWAGSNIEASAFHTTKFEISALGSTNLEQSCSGVD